MTAGQWTGRGRRRRCLAQLPPLRGVEVARLFGWTGSSPLPLSFEGRVVLALLEAEKGKVRDLREERKVVESLIPGRKEGKQKTQKNQSGKKIRGQVKLALARISGSRF